MPPKHKQQKKKAQKHKPSTPKTGIVKHLSSGKPAKGHGGYAEDIGGSIGGWLGQKAGSLFRSITGLGDYKVQSNTLVAATDPPILSNTTAATRVQHREYICDIIGSVGWATNTFYINPGLNSTFPWLSSVAGAFEEYRLHGIVFEFKSTSADALNSTNTALGTVIMATEYNVLHDPFANKREMENYVYSTSSPPSVSAMHPVECARDVNVLENLYVRNVAPLATSDLRFSDLGRFQLSTIGMQAAAVIGELWCTYDVELIKPKLPDAFSATAPTHFQHDMAVYGHSVLQNSNIYGSNGVKWKTRGNGLSTVTLSDNTMTFQTSGRYFISFDFAGSVAFSVNLYNKLTASNSITVVAAFANGLTGGTWQSDTPGSGTSSNRAGLDIMIDVVMNTNVVPTLTWDTTVSLPGSNTYGDIFVVPLPNGFSTPSPRSRIDMLEDAVKALYSKVSNAMEEEMYVEEDYKEALPTNAPPNTARLPAELTKSTVNLLLDSLRRGA